MAAAPANNDAAAARAGTKRPLPGSAANSERRVQPRHFHFGPNPAAESVAASASGDHAAAESDCSPPATRLYRHALESIFGFLNQRELVAALQVSKDWLAEVKSTASLRLKVAKPSASLRGVARSAMGHHVAELGGGTSYVTVNANSLITVARLTPQLRVLKCDLKLTPSVEPLTFPIGLRELHLGMIGNPSVANVNTTIEIISRLPLLNALALFVPAIDSQVSFAPLASLPLLRILGINRLDGFNTQAANLSDAQIAQLGALRSFNDWNCGPCRLRCCAVWSHSPTICSGSRSRCLVC